MNWIPWSLNFHNKVIIWLIISSFNLFFPLPIQKKICIKMRRREKKHVAKVKRKKERVSWFLYFLISYYTISKNQIYSHYVTYNNNFESVVVLQQICLNFQCVCVWECASFRPLFIMYYLISILYDLNILFLDKIQNIHKWSCLLLLYCC